jgi:hypothetical protein
MRSIDDPWDGYGREMAIKYHHYTHSEGEPDDALHSFIYALIAEAIGRISGPLAVTDLFG